jgi:hypothetical protein
LGIGLVGTWRGALPHAASIPTIKANTAQRKTCAMTLLLLEALGAGLIFIGIIWWTMFSGRKNGELAPPPKTEDDDTTR